MSPVQFNIAVALRHCMYKSPPKNYPPLFIVLDRSPIHPKLNGCLILICNVFFRYKYLFICSKIRFLL